VGNRPLHLTDFLLRCYSSWKAKGRTRRRLKVEEGGVWAGKRMRDEGVKRKMVAPIANSTTYLGLTM
jgi:hypothetical protein